MGYTLTARKKGAAVEEMNVGLFTWPMYLQETGAGYVLGYGEGRSPGSYVYKSGGQGSPVSNDGYKVSSREAKMMAAVIRGYISVQKFVNKEWDKLSPEDRERDEVATGYKGKPIYRARFHEDHLSALEKISDFMEQSGGFTIS
jgi:hypothetical protein